MIRPASLLRHSAAPSVLCFLLLAICATLAALPALRGDWIYDDFKMLNNPALDDAGDVFSAFMRDSSDYLGQRTSGEGQAVTYRPLSNATLVLPFLLSKSPRLSSHLITFFLYLCIGGLLLWMDQRRWHRLTLSGALLTALILLHPTFGEAWLWVSGRQDALAGAFLMASAALLTPGLDSTDSTPQRLSAVRFSALVLTALAALLSKESVLPVLLAVFLASALPYRWTGSVDMSVCFRAAFVRVGPVLLAVLLYVLLRSIAVGDHTGMPSLITVFKRWPLISAIGLETVLSPVPRPMRMLAFEYHLGWTGARIAAGIALASLVVFLGATGRVRTLVLLAGGLGSLLLCGFTVDYFWQGFDRYLLFPGLMGVLSLLWGVKAAPISTWRWGYSIPILIALILFVSLHLQARVYRSQRTFVEASLSMDADSGIGQMWVARQYLFTGEKGRALSVLREVEHLSLPAPMPRNAAAIALDAGDPAVGEHFLERAYWAAPDFPGTRRDLLIVRAWRGRWDEVESLARGLLAEPDACETTRLELQRVLKLFPAPAEKNEILNELTAEDICRYVR